MFDLNFGHSGVISAHKNKDLSENLTPKGGPLGEKNSFSSKMFSELDGNIFEIDEIFC